MAIWRSAGWPTRDAIELDLLAAGWVEWVREGSGLGSLRLTDAGIRLLAEARQRRARPQSAHDRLAERVCSELVAQGRIVWRELALRARIEMAVAPSPDEAGLTLPTLPALTQLSLTTEGERETGLVPAGTPKATWRMARPDVFSVRNTSVEAYLHPLVHEVKASRADLLCDLRNPAKREAYRWLSCETYFVFPQSVAQPDEIPAPFGVYFLQGDIETGTLVLARPARHARCRLPFPVWLALAKAHAVYAERDEPQGELAAAQAEPG
jgi:hypothetical protein